MSTIRKGNYYRNRTRQWLEQEGWTVAVAETNYGVYTGDRVVYVKRDLWGGDLIAKNEEEIVWVQVKANDGDVAAGAKQLLAAGPWPGVSLWVVYWPPRRLIKVGPEIFVITPGCPEPQPDCSSSRSGKTGSGTGRS